MNIAEILKQQAQRDPEAIALIDTYRGRERQYSFSELEDASAKAAALFSQRDLKPDDAILVFLPMSFELYATLIAIFRLGLVAMFLDPSAGRVHIARCCALHPPKAFIGSAKSHLLRFLCSALRRIPHKFVVGSYVPGAINWRHADQLMPAHHIVSRQTDAAALITFTSGSTGQPKGAIRSHGFLIAQHQALEESLALKPGQLDLSTLPIFVLANLASGVTSLIPDTDLLRPGAIDGKKVMRQIKRLSPNRTAASPAFYTCLIEYCRQHGDSLTSFQHIYTGGAPVFPRLLAQLQQSAQQGNVVAVYGSTEAEPIAHIAYSEISEFDIQAMISGKGLLAGLPVSCVTLRIIKMQFGEPIGPYDAQEFNKQILVSGEVGEIVVSGQHVLKGYLNGLGDEETKFDVADQRWHRTGDAGYLDHHGRLWLMGRCAALINDKKGTLNPFAVESAAMNLTDVRRAALVRHRDKRLLLIEEIKKGGCCVTKISKTLGWAELDEIRIIRSIPMDKRHNAKIDYLALMRNLDTDKLTLSERQ